MLWSIYVMVGRDGWRTPKYIFRDIDVPQKTATQIATDYAHNNGVYVIFVEGCVVRDKPIVTLTVHPNGVWYEGP